MASERIRKNATVEIGIVKMTIEEIIKSIKHIENEITLAKFLSELKVSKNDRVVIYDDSDNWSLILMNLNCFIITSFGICLKKLSVVFQM